MYEKHFSGNESDEKFLGNCWIIGELASAPPQRILIHRSMESIQLLQKAHFASFTTAFLLEHCVSEAEKKSAIVASMTNSRDDIKTDK